MIVTLTPQEHKFACAVGRMWVELGILKGYHKLNSLEPEKIVEVNERGACGEFAAAKVLNLPWHYQDPVNRPCDIGQQTNVYCTPRLDGNLLIEDKNPLERFYVLVYAIDRVSYDVYGYISGSTEKKRWRQDLPKPAWFIRAEDLTRTETIA